MHEYLTADTVPCVVTSYKYTLAVEYLSLKVFEQAFSNVYTRNVSKYACQDY
jgi:hypothetical protein